MTFNLYLKDSNSDTPTSVRLVVRHNQQTYAYYTGISIHSGDWIGKRQRSKAGAGNPAGKQINNQLTAIKNRAEKSWRSYMTECLDYQRRPTFGDFTNRLKNDLDLLLMKKDRADDLFSPMNFIPNYIQRLSLEHEKRTGTVALKSPGTLRKYRLVWKHLQRFVKENNRRLTFNKLDLAFSQVYRRWRFDEGAAINTVWKELATISHWLTQAHREGYNPYSYNKNPKWNVKEHHPKNMYLTWEQAQELYSLKDLPPHLRRTVDEFICAMFSGVRYSDFASIMDVENIGQDPDGFKYFVVDQRKTSYRCNIPVHPMVETILHEYGGCIPSVSNQKVNKYIKDAAKLTSWGKDKVFTDHSAGGKVTSKVVERWTQISSHTARRSFATNMYLSGVQKDTIMRITGHKTEESFDRYISLNDIEHAKMVGLNTDYVQAFKRTGRMG